VIVKVCGVRTAAVADAAVDAGADWIGLVFEPRSPRHVDDAQAQEVVAAVGGRAALIGVMVAPDVSRCEELAERHHLDAVQLHGDVAAAEVALMPVPVIRALNVRDAAEALTLQWWPDLLLMLDSAPADADALPGGTGKSIDLAVAALVQRHRPVILAGGLDPQSVGAAVRAVRPLGVDASSGLEVAPGVKDIALVRAYVRAAREAEQ
jgi:phosphoribosylanthranilate isomerase